MRARRGYGKHTIPQRALSALEAGGDMTSEEIAVAIGASAKSTQATLARMKPEGLLHICGWLRPGKRGPLLAKYRIGPGEDAPHIGPARAFG